MNIRVNIAIGSDYNTTARFEVNVGVPQAGELNDRRYSEDIVSRELQRIMGEGLMSIERQMEHLRSVEIEKNPRLAALEAPRHFLEDDGELV